MKWRVPYKTNGRLTHYLITARQVNQSSAKGQNIKVLPNVTNTIIANLKPYTGYLISVQAYTLIGGGNKSEISHPIGTLEDGKMH